MNMLWNIYVHDDDGNGEKHELKTGGLAAGKNAISSQTSLVLLLLLECMSSMRKNMSYSASPKLIGYRDELAKATPKKWVESD